MPDVIRDLEAETGVSAAQPNYRFTLAQQPQARSMGADVSNSQYALAKLHLPQAHRFATGDRVLVAVIDSGIDITHPEIAGFVAASFDALNSKEPPHPHGTAMAGAIVAHARLMGVAPAARILAIRAFGAHSTGAEGTTLTLLRAIDWAVAHHARIINMSFAGPSDPEIAHALAAAHKKGVVLVAASGNAGAKSPPLFPASDASVIAVTATDAGDKLFKLANRGKHIAVAAPGVEIIGPSTNGGYQISTGTSVAAAQVSGVAALLLERKPDLRPDALRKISPRPPSTSDPRGRTASSARVSSMPTGRSSRSSRSRWRPAAGPATPAPRRHASSASSDLDHASWMKATSREHDTVHCTPSRRERRGYRHVADGGPESHVWRCGLLSRRDLHCERQCRLRQQGRAGARKGRA